MKSQKLGLLLGANVIAACLVMQGCKAPKAAGPAPESVAIKETQEQPAVKPVKPTPSPVETKEQEVPAAPIVEVKPLPPPPKAVEPVATPEAKKDASVYTVRSGDTLSGISAKLNVRMGAIISLNPGINPNRIRIGQKIKIPAGVTVPEEKDAPKAVKATAANTKAPATKAVKPYTGATKEYVVRSGDSLGRIAYENGIKIRQLKEMNGLKSDDIRIGQKLRIPAEKQAAARKEVKANNAGAKKSTEVVAVAEKPEAKPEEKKPEEAAVSVAAEVAPVAVTETPAVETPAADASAVKDSAPVAAEPATPATTEYTVKEGEDIVSVAISCGVSPSALMDLNGLKAGDTLKAGQKLKLPASR